MAWILLRPSNYKQVAPLVRTGGSRHTGLAALPHRNIQNRVRKQKTGSLIELLQLEGEMGKTYYITFGNFDCIVLPQHTKGHYLKLHGVGPENIKL